MVLSLLHDTQASGLYNMTAPLLKLAMGELPACCLKGKKCCLAR